MAWRAFTDHLGVVPVPIVTLPEIGAIAVGTLSGPTCWPRVRPSWPPGSGR
jgi:hypothetical protein